MVYLAILSLVLWQQGCVQPVPNKSTQTWKPAKTSNPGNLGKGNLAAPNLGGEGGLGTTGRIRSMCYVLIFTQLVYSTGCLQVKQMPPHLEAWLAIYHRKAS